MNKAASGVQQHKQMADAKQQMVKAESAETSKARENTAYTRQDAKHVTEKASINTGIRHSSSATEPANNKQSTVALDDVHNKKAAVTDAGAKAKPFTQTTDWTWDEVNSVAKSLPVTTRSSRQSNTLGEYVADAYQDPTKWAAAVADRVSHVSKELSAEFGELGLQRSRNVKFALNMPIVDAMAAEAGGDLGMAFAKMEGDLATQYKMASKQLSRLSLFASKGVLVLDIAEKGFEVAQAPKGERLRTSFEKGMELAGEGIGAFLGDVLVTAAAPETAGLSLIAAPAVTVGASAVGGYEFEKLAKNAEKAYDYITHKSGM